MATEPQTKPIHLEDNIQTNLESDLALEMLRVVEAAAIASAREMGTGDRKKAEIYLDQGLGFVSCRAVHGTKRSQARLPRC